MRKTQLAIVGFEDGERAMSQGLWWPLEAGRGKETDSFFEPSVGTGSNPSMLAPQDPFQSPDYQSYNNSVVLSHWLCGNLLPQP